MNDIPPDKQHGACEGGCENCENAEDPGRRKFLGAAVVAINLGLVAVISAPTLGFLAAPLGHRPKREWIPIATLDQVPDAGAVEVTFTVRVQDGYQTVDRRYAMFLRREEGEVVCIDPACTHLGCRVVYHGDQDRFLCPCHGGVFDQAGNVVSGPPTRPLDRQQTKVENGQIWLLREV
jgi:Rieske Fe-S protein